MVILAANTGNDIISKKAVVIIAYKNNDKLKYLFLGFLKYRTVTKKFKALIILDALAKCRAKITKSIDASAVPTKEENGGYIVHLLLNLILDT